MLGLSVHGHVTAGVASTWWHLVWGGFGTFPSGPGQPCHGPWLPQTVPCPCWAPLWVLLGGTITFEDRCGPRCSPCCWSIWGFYRVLTAKPDALGSWQCPQSCATHRAPSARPALPAPVFRAPWIHSCSRRPLFSSSLDGRPAAPLAHRPAEP